MTESLAGHTEDNPAHASPRAQPLSMRHPRPCRALKSQELSECRGELEQGYVLPPIHPYIIQPHPREGHWQEEGGPAACAQREHSAERAAKQSRSPCSPSSGAHHLVCAPHLSVTQWGSPGKDVSHPRGRCPCARRDYLTCGCKHPRVGWPSPVPARDRAVHPRKNLELQNGVCTPWVSRTRLIGSSVRKPVTLGDKSGPGPGTEQGPTQAFYPWRSLPEKAGSGQES